MRIADHAFFEAYKRLDKLCSDLYACKNGISEYIAQMERLSYQGRARVSSWTQDYKMLKHIRWIRNQIAHDPDSYQISKHQDRAFVQDFHSRILSGDDPITLLRKTIAAEKRVQRRQKKQRSTQAPNPTKPRTYKPARKKSRAWIGAVVGVGIIVLILLVLFLHSV